VNEKSSKIDTNKLLTRALSARDCLKGAKALECVDETGRCEEKGDRILERAPPCKNVVQNKRLQQDEYYQNDDTARSSEW
jgi:hypothetical protein